MISCFIAIFCSVSFIFVKRNIHSSANTSFNNSLISSTGCPLSPKLLRWVKNAFRTRQSLFSMYQQTVWREVHDKANPNIQGIGARSGVSQLGTGTSKYCQDRRDTVRPCEYTGLVQIKNHIWKFFLKIDYRTF